MKTRLILLMLLSMSITAQYAHARPGNACVNPIKASNDPIVGVWNGDLTAPTGTDPVAINIAFDLGGTGSGMDINDIGASGSLGSVQSYAWKRIKRKQYEVLMSNFFDFGGVFVRLGIVVTGAMSDDCQVLSLAGKLSAYQLEDRKLEFPFITLPVTIDLERVNDATHMDIPE